MKKNLLIVIRIVVGVLFIFSGLIKANDPLGLSYKMQEFFEVWNMASLDAWSLWLSIFMIAFEILAGVAVLLGWRMQLFSWLLLLLIIFFSFLTGYAVLSGKIRECGCFGDCIPLQAMGSFIKDLILLVLILILFVFRKEIKPAFAPAVSFALLGITVILTFSFQWYVMRYLPLLDCLPYKAGANIPEKMKPPVNAIPDSSVINFVYRKNGKELEFTAANMPADLDSTYSFVKRYDKLIRKGNAEPAIKDFSLSTADGLDTTVAILDRPGYKLLMFSRHFPDSVPSWNGYFAALLTVSRMKGVPVYVVTSARSEATAWLSANALEGEIPVFDCDATAVKTAARADPTIYLIKKGTIVGKWSYASMNDILPDLIQLKSQPGAAPQN